MSGDLRLSSECQISLIVSYQGDKAQSHRNQNEGRYRSIFIPFEKRSTGESNPVLISG